jgi:hypothetical protein
VSHRFSNNPLWQHIVRIRNFYVDSQHNSEKAAENTTQSLRQFNVRSEPAKVRFTGKDRSPGKTGNRKIKKKVHYKRENLLKACIFSYVNPVQLETTNMSAKWYEEYKIVETKKFSIIALVNGWKVEFQIQKYEFHKVLDTTHKKARLISHVRQNPKGTYKGWIHHVNYYGGISGKFIEQEILNFHL